MEDNAQLHNLMNMADCANAMRAAQRRRAFDVSGKGETIPEIAQRIGLSVNKTRALVHGGLHLKVLCRDGEKIFPNAEGWPNAASRISEWLHQAYAMRAALEKDFFEIPDKGEMPLEIAQRTGISPLKMRGFIATGLSLGVLQVEEDGRIFLSGVGKDYLREDSICSMKRVLQWGPLDYESFWDAFVLGRHPNIFEEGNEEMARLMVDSMDQKSGGVAWKVANQLDLTGVRTLVDVGAGSGIFSIELCKRFSDLQVTALDLGHVCPIMGEYIGRAGMTGRVKPKDCDMFTDEFGKADAFFLSDVAHDHPDELIRIPLKKAYKALNPGGRVILVEVVLDEGGAGPFGAVTYAFPVIKMLPKGRQRSQSEHEVLLREAGFVSATAIPTYSNATLIQAFKA